jgi:CRISPR-associated protein Cmr5
MPRYLKNVEQQRAKKAYEFVESAVTKYKQKSTKIKEYKSYIRSIPMMIKNHGINNAFAFVLSKSKEDNAYTLIDEQMREWFKDKITTEKSFVQYLITLNTLEYRKITIETFAFFAWLKRFAEGLIETEDDTQGEEEENE